MTMHKIVVNRGALLGQPILEVIEVEEDDEGFLVDRATGRHLIQNATFDTLPESVKKTMEQVFYGMDFVQLREGMRVKLEHLIRSDDPRMTLLMYGLPASEPSKEVELEVVACPFCGGKDVECGRCLGKGTIRVRKMGTFTSATPLKRN